LAGVVAADLAQNLICFLFIEKFSVGPDYGRNYVAVIGRHFFTLLVDHLEVALIHGFGEAIVGLLVNFPESHQWLMIC
jgi:hypothetical protein